MNCVADENVDLAVVRALPKAHHEVWYVAEQASGITDPEVLTEAARRSALLISMDKDFGDLVYRQGRATGGVLLVRLVGMSAARRGRLVADAVTRHGAELVGAFSVLTLRALRIRRADRAT